ncbi:MAG: ABC transporter permease [Acidobacteriota bacterium]
MMKVFILIIKEMKSYFYSPTAYVVLTGFLILTGYFFFNLVSQFSLLLANYTYLSQIYGNAELLEQVNLNDMIASPLLRNMLVIFLFITPLLSMRTFSEEKKQRTEELLLTSPITTGQLVAAKFIAALLMGTILILLTFIYMGILALYGDPEKGPLFTGYLGIWLALIAFLSIGLFVSSMTENQIVAAIGSFIIMLMLFVIDWPSEAVGGRLGAILSYLSVSSHITGFVKGTIDTKDIIYFISIIIVSIFLTKESIDIQRGR